jgi:Trk-type K+ transport system membrane component
MYHAVANNDCHLAVRAAGFVVIGIPSLYIGVQVIYLIMMYIAVYPVVITMRTSNVYEERSLGIYEDDPSVKEQLEQDQQAVGKDDNPKPLLRRRKTAAAIGKQIRRATTFQGVGVRAPSNPEEEASSISFVSQQIKGQLAHDLWWLVLAIIIIVVIETDHFLTDPVTFSVFNILFEATSAYACVGLSVGLPTQSYSFSGGLHRGSKLVLCLVMMRGRHRGLPVAIDRAVRLPGENLITEEEEDSRIRRSKTMHRMVSHDE